MNPFLENPEFSFILLTIFKWFLIIGTGFYAVFAFVVIRQISVMKKTIITKLSPEITILGYVHFVFVLVVLAVSAGL